MKKKSRSANKISAAAVAVGLSVAPAQEVDSGVSYGGSIGIDLNKNVSVGGYVTSTDKANSLFGKMGLNYILMGRDKGNLSLGVGGGYLLANGLSPSIEGIYTPKSETPFSIGAGLGYGLVKKNEGNGNDVNGERNNIDETLNGAGGEEPLRCIGGTITEEGECECPEGTVPFLSAIENKVTCRTRG